MRSIMFANKHAKEAYKLTYTVGSEESRVRFLDKLALSLWDCGG